MLSRILLISMSLILFIGSYDSQLFAKTANDMASDQEMNAYYGKLQAEIDKQNTRVQELLKKSGKPQIEDQLIRLQVEHATAMLDVKKTLYANFYDTESLKRSPAERDMLLRLLSKEDISVADLTSLQSLVRQEKSRLGIN